MSTNKQVKKGSKMPAKKTIPKKTSKTLAPKKLKSQKVFSLSRPAIFALAFAIVGVIVLVTSFAAPKEPKLQKFVNNPGKGWVWDGLRAPKPGSKCDKDAVEMVNPKTGEAFSCTHGPDPVPNGVDVKNSVQPVQTGEEDVTALSPNGTTTTAPTLNGGGVPCDGDGQTGSRIQLIYAHASDVTDRYKSFATSFQIWAANMNNVFVQSGLETGQGRNIRFVTDANCNVVVPDVTLSATGDDNMTNTELEMQSLGYSGSDRKYMIWMDANVYCGLADIRYDDKPSADNINNSGRSWARVDNACWGDPSQPEAHELMHNLGGVQPTAPHASYAWHCTDDYDRMCYQDNPNLYNYGGTASIVCSYSHESLFDCNHDDYFTTATPAAGSYLETHWNAANSIFLFAGGTNTPPPTGGDTTAPNVTVTKPLAGSKIGNTTAISANASDNVSVIKMEIYVDGALKASSATNTVSYSWSSRKASPGSHTITVKAYDAAGNVGLRSVSVTK